MLERKHLFEFTDLNWWPKALRSLLTDYLHTVVEINRPFSEKVHLIADALTATSQRRVVDLCSGHAGPWLHLNKELKDKTGYDVEITLTDKYPSDTASEKIAAMDNVDYHADSVDALDVPDDLHGVRTLFNGFHHFEEEAAQGILADAIEKKQATVVFEMLQREWKDIFAILLFVPFMVLFITPRIRPFSMKRILFTYATPVTILLVLWDTIVSTLRCYTPNELEKMAQAAGGDDYNWDIGTYRSGFLPVTYMLGHPKT